MEGMDASRIFPARTTSADLERMRATAEMTYRRKGVEPPEWKPDEIPVTLSMMLAFGWRIESGPDGRNILVSPTEN